MHKNCFICKEFSLVKPIGLNDLGLKEVHTCGSCDTEMKKMQVKSLIYETPGLEIVKSLVDKKWYNL